MRRRMPEGLLREGSQGVRGLQAAPEGPEPALKTALIALPAPPSRAGTGQIVRSRADVAGPGTRVTFSAHAALIAPFNGTGKLKVRISLS